jgi:hypothetical protein
MADIQLNKALVTNIYNTDALPTTWATYQTRAKVLDRNWRAGQQARAGKTLHLLHATPSSTPKTTWVPKPQLPQQQRQPARDPYAMEVDVTRTAAVANSTPSPRKMFSLDANGRVIGGRDQVMAAGACHYCKVPGHMIKACPELTAKDARKGAYSPLQKPSNFVARNCETSISSSPGSPIPLYENSLSSQIASIASGSDYTPSDSGFVVSHE